MQNKTSNSLVGIWWDRFWSLQWKRRLEKAQNHFGISGDPETPFDSTEWLPGISPPRDLLPPCKCVAVKKHQGSVLGFLSLPRPNVMCNTDLPCFFAFPLTEVKYSHEKWVPRECNSSEFKVTLKTLHDLNGQLNFGSSDVKVCLHVTYV